ncbi:MAG: PmoA family protein [Candidatus Brocadiae bacterium]|nr:PmoA family protein [Candidatus Brocadiia bacterium]
MTIRLLVLCLVGVACLSATVTTNAAALGIVLEVPALDAPLHVAVPVPNGALVPGDDMPTLVEEGAIGTSIAYDLVPLLAADGSAHKTRLRLMATIPPRPGATGVRRFAFKPARGSTTRKAFAISDVNDKSVRLDGLSIPGVKRPVLVYNHGMISKEGVPARYNRAGYIHPLYDTNGVAITEDFPKDHPHHRGVWWSWPHIKIDGKEYNSWIPTGIHTKHERWVLKHEGTAAGILAAENGWYVGEKKVMREFVWIIAYAAPGSTRRTVDIELTWTPVGKPIALQGAGGKSYGGLTYRFAQAEGQPSANRRKDTKIIIDSGLTKKDLPNTRLAWADITGHAAGAKIRSGCAVFVPKDHPDFPPTWLTRHYGPLCVGWPGVKARTFPPGEPFGVRYRLLVHVGDPAVPALKAAYAAYNTHNAVKLKPVTP